MDLINYTINNITVLTACIHHEFKCLGIPLRFTIRSRDCINRHTLATGACIQSVVKTIAEKSVITHKFKEDSIKPRDMDTQTTWQLLDKSWPAVIQLMACHLLNSKSLPEPVVTYAHLEFCTPPRICFLATSLQVYILFSLPAQYIVWRRTYKASVSSYPLPILSVTALGYLSCPKLLGWP